MVRRHRSNKKKFNLSAAIKRLSKKMSKRLGCLPKRKCQFGPRRRFRSRFGSSDVSATPAPVMVSVPVQYGPGYDATSQQSYFNGAVPYYGDKVPWINASNYWFPVSNGEVQAPDMLIR